MSTLAEFMIIASADNHPPMLEKSMYDSRKSRMELYIENRENGIMILNSVLNGLLVWPTIDEENGTTRTKKYEELLVTEKLHADCDLKATNIILQGFPSDVYAIINHHKVAKEIWDRVKLLMVKHCISLVVPVFTQGDDLIAYINKAMAFLSAVAASRVMLLVPREIIQEDRQGLLNVINGKVNDIWLGNALSLRVQGTLHGLRKRKCWLRHKNLTGDLDAYDSYCDDVSNAKAVLIANLSNYGLDVISKEKESLLQTFTVFKKESKEKESKYMDKEIDFKNKIKELDNIVYKVGQSAQTVHMLTKPQVFYDDTHKQALGYQNLFYLKKAQRIKPTLYDGSVISRKHAVISVIDDEETLILEEVSQSKMIAKQNDLISKEKKINTTPVNYVELNRLFKDFGKRFVPQQELSAEQAFWLQTFNPNTNQSDISPVKIEAPRELPKKENGDVMLCVMNSTTVFGNSVNVEMQSSESCDKCSDLDAELLTKQTAYNELLKDKSCDNQNALEIPEYFENNDLKAQLQAKDTTISKMKEHIKSIRENDKEEKVKQEMDEIETINIELEHSQIQEKVFVTTTLQNELRRLKGKNMFDNATTITNATTIALGMFKLDLDPLAPRLLKNRDAHIDYLKYTQEQADILQGIVEQANAKQPLDNALDFSCKHAKRIHELLVYVRDTCPNANKPSDKLVDVTPMNKVKKVRFFEPLRSSNNIHKEVESSKTQDSNILVLPSTGLKSSTSASRSQPTSNKKNDRILQTPGFPDCSLVFGLRMLKTYDRKPLSAHELQGLEHNLLLVRQLCDSDLEVAFWKNTCFIWNLDGVDLLLGSKDTNLYTISLDDMLKTSSICLLSKASKTKSWLWHRRLSHLNFDYSRFTWVKFLRSKDEAPDAIIKCIKNIQVRLNATVRNVRTDNGTEFVNQTLRVFYENVSILHQTSVARTPQQNSVVKIQN
ncbi:retrovirus-related pol polyprotein from transposon TNT 1-94 [Tanacetum coccineum]